MYTRLLVSTASARFSRTAMQTQVCRSRGLASTIVSRAALAAETNNNSDTQTPKKTHPASSAADGTVLKGLNIYKSGQDPVALKDEEYPDWLWTLLDKVPFEEKSEIEQQRLNRSKAIKEANFMKGRK